MPVWHAYFDESGHRADSKVLVVGGYLIRAGKARKLDKEWRHVLRRYELPYFHMVDCAHGNGVHGHLGKHRNVAVETELIALIKKYAEIGLACVIACNRYHAPDDHEDRDTYVAAVRNLHALVAHELKTRSPKKLGPVSIFFEAGHDSQNKAVRVAELYRREDPDVFKAYSFGGKADVPLLQMADLFVWQLAKNVKDRVEGKRPPRKDYMSLVQQDHFHLYIARKDNKIMLCKHESPHWESGDIDHFIKEFFSDGPVTEPGIKAFYEGVARLEREGR